MITQAQKDYFIKNFGSYENYVAGQRARYVNAANSTPSNFALMAKLEADAKRLFYTLPTVTTNGGYNGIGSGSSGAIVTKDSGGIVNPEAAGSAGASIGEGIGSVLSKISLNNFLVIVGVVFGFVILKKAFKAVR